MIPIDTAVKPDTHSPPTCNCCHCRVCRAEHAAWQEAHQQPPVEPDYWMLAKRPLACLLFLLPLLAVYEAGVIWMGGKNPAQVRNGADAWMRVALESAGVPFGFVLPVLVVVVLLGWHWRVRASVESLRRDADGHVRGEFAVRVSADCRRATSEHRLRETRPPGNSARRARRQSHLV